MLASQVAMLSESLCKEPSGELGGVVFPAEEEAKQDVRLSRRPVRARARLERHQMSQTSSEKQETSGCIQCGRIGKRHKEIQWTPPPTSRSLGS